MFRRMKIYLFN